MKIYRRITAVLTALAGGFDEVIDHIETIRTLRTKVDDLYAAADNLQKDRDKWFEMWQRDGLGHANAQEMMAQEIDALIQLLTQAINLLEQKDVDVSTWRARMRGYANASGFLDAVHRNRENFLSISETEAKKPDFCSHS